MASHAMLAVAVAAVWLASLGFARLRNPLARLHAAAFAGVVPGPLILLAAVFQFGATPAMLKLLFLVVSLLLSGAALLHVIGRAIHIRNRQGAGSA